MRDVPPTPHQSLIEAVRVARANGVHHAYAGNVHDAYYGSTWCDHCGELLIERDWYQLGKWNLTDDGHCTHCGTKCAGVFDGPAGDWGAKRQPIQIN
jgi:pyruvate formate lyase activating enzyme